MAFDPSQENRTSLTPRTERDRLAKGTTLRRGRRVQDQMGRSGARRSTRPSSRDRPRQPDDAIGGH